MIIEIPTPIKTEECKYQLNLYLGDKKWKRIFKFGNNLRAFQGNDGAFVIIGKNGLSRTQIYTGINKEIKSELDSIREVSKFYYTHDCGEVFYNPYTKKLWISGGDGGYMYSVKKITKNNLDSDEDDSGDFMELFPHDNFVEFNCHPNTKFIKEVTWEAENNPKDKEYILVSQINLIDY